MSEQQPDEPTLTPQPNRILAEPADVAACQRDYAAGADVRDTIAQQDARRS
ncbi:hypothetical protein [Streptomyces sp. NBC_01373]|uniref:hypothetical protein n=1 Tax=Streptomyces sp. NBC_01373 TaxID=2903843 RepID=UPI00225A3CCF|nr:hypothetical protein [Streptomyces sp. NBC_01373]MCX4703891.1 hypothetical protein [Streptomyces sp. NBC_01373]